MSNPLARPLETVDFNGCLEFGITMATRNLWIKPALDVVDVVASAFEDEEDKKVEDVKPEE